MAGPSVCGISLKFVSLITLTVQNSLLTILLHYSRTNAAPYSASAAVLLNELLKGSISFAVALYNSYQEHPDSGKLPVSTQDNFLNTQKHLSDEKRRSHSTTFNVKGSDANAWRLRGIDLGIRLKRLRSEVISPDCWKLSIPAILYVIQNNLQFVAASNLDVATFQVSYQMKILTTALFSVVLLKRKLSMIKWASLFFLAVGVAIVQLQAVDSNTKSKSDSRSMDPLIGSLAVAAACFTSGLAGVYFEMVLKGSKADLWVRNVQLSAFSILPALCPAFFPNLSLKAFLGLAAPLDTIVVSKDAWMFSGFGFWAWSVVLCQVFGGLITALVIKFSDNIMKGFATSLSIVLSFIAGILLFGSELTLGFIVGCSIVLGATYAYNKPDHAPITLTHRNAT